ncbi:MAG: hypothetical protein A4E20_11900 [Nitrospira sp. SG-bin2]|uniref:hypothetical protein n=1 Tax=Nitrospira cf. moscoviensis SBR1015 TaxID=96242 RepID=UPI000A0C80BD|nr:hypothetical protein [Nitrospira cf. moscoviensis SBR1015]OQW34131.1 MAG: hypothetical protein A4E20_11900 [Nitrospira sp. SG-bin2]
MTGREELLRLAEAWVKATDDWHYCEHDLAGATRRCAEAESAFRTALATYVPDVAGDAGAQERAGALVRDFERSLANSGWSVACNDLVRAISESFASAVAAAGALEQEP